LEFIVEPIIAIALARFIYRSTKLLVSPEPEDVQARKQIKEDFKREVIDNFKAGWNTPLEEIRRQDAESAAMWRRVGKLSAVGFIIVCLLSFFSALANR
jgi:phosphate/sulfate permease